MCEEEPATIDYCESIMEYTHGMIKKICEFCRYFYPLGSESDKPDAVRVGICKRYPPTVQVHLLPTGTSNIIGGQQKMTVVPQEFVSWPKIVSTESCGEFKNE